MATMKIDQLNSPVEQVVEPSNVLDIDTFFDEMYLSDSEIEERKDLAKNIYTILAAILAIIKANEVLKNSHDIAYYKDYVIDSMSSLYKGVFNSNKYQSQIESFANDFVDSTMRHIDTPYFTSDDRAIVNAEQQSNAIYNQEQYQQAVASGKTRKTWVTMHDQRVRKNHDAADGQEVDIDKPFEVGDSELMFPCDLSLGANLREICNCRCVVVYSGENDSKSGKDLSDSPTIKNAYLSNSRDSFETFLLGAKGNEAMKVRLLMASDNTEVEERLNNKSPFSYDPNTNKIIYNSSHARFKSYDMIYAMSHEYAHAVDYQELRSWENADYITSIEKARYTLYDNLDKIKEWFADGGVYQYDAATSDIISALSGGTLNNFLPATHSIGYWDDLSVPKEIFANTTAIDISENNYSEFRNLFENLFDSYERLVQWKKS